MTSELEQDYTRAGFRARLGFGNAPTVLVVDIVRAYLEPSSPLYAGVEEAVEAAAQVVDAARSAGVPVIFTRVEYRPGLRDGGIFARKVPSLAVFEAGNELGHFPGRPAPREGELVISKQYASAFFGTSLASTLTAQGTDTVVIVGLSTSGCVRATAVDACQHGFIPVVVADAVGDRDVRPHDANLFDIDAKYGDVVDLETAISALTAR